MDKRQRRPYGDMEDDRIVLRTLGIGAIIVVLLLGIYFWGRWLEDDGEGEIRGDIEARFTRQPSIMYQGQAYSPKNNIMTILFLGIDQSSQGEEEASPVRNGGQADFLLLMIMDSKEKIITPLQIDRDTMTEITMLNVLGKEAGTRRAQLCLAHSFGKTDTQSAALTAQAVSTLLLGVKVDFYLAMNLDGIGALNDAVGGVEVVLEEDFTSLDTRMGQGNRITLWGKQAEYYVRNRWGIGVGTNEARMERQLQYFNAFGEKFQQSVHKSGEFTGKLFDEVEPYLTTNMKRGRLVNEAWKSREYEYHVMERLAGAYMDGADGFREFHADPESLEQLIIDIFYDPVE